MQCYQLIVLPVILFLVYDASAEIVNTTYGLVDGATVQLDDGTFVNSWYGIPYAAPPVGNLRFEPPQPPRPWKDVFNATQLPNACIQDARYVTDTHPGWNKFSEDCLNLNIFAPKNLSAAPFAVMVWIFEGDYGGANIEYPGHFLAAKDVVVVIPNYRMGIFGFLSTPGGTIKGNMGLKDQTLALKWIRDNIASFGGDAGKVTLFGTGLGATSVALHMLSPLSQGLFHGTIMQSGAHNNPWSIGTPDQYPETYVYQTAGKANCTTKTETEMINCLRNRTADEIKIAASIVCVQRFFSFCTNYVPVVDGPGGFLPNLPSVLAKSFNASHGVPTLSGMPTNAGSTDVAFLIPAVKQGGFNSTMFAYYLKTRLLAFVGSNLTASCLEDIAQAIVWFYTKWPYPNDLDANRQGIIQMLTDWAFGYSWDDMLKFSSINNPNTFGYLFSYLSPRYRLATPQWMGATYAIEMPYVWGLPKLVRNPQATADSGLNAVAVGSNWTQEDITYSDFIITLWTNFAKYGNPTPVPVKLPFNDTTFTWPRFSSTDNQKVLNLDTETSTLTNYNQQNYAFYTNYLTYIVNKYGTPATTVSPATSSTAKTTTTFKPTTTTKKPKKKKNKH